MDPYQQDDWSLLGIKEVLDADSRPTFIIDLDQDEVAPPHLSRIRPIFVNAALRSHAILLAAICGNGAAISLGVETGPSSYGAFQSWATEEPPYDVSGTTPAPSFLYRDLLWTHSTVRTRWRLVSGSYTALSEGSIYELPSTALNEVKAIGSLVIQAERVHEQSDTDQSEEATVYVKPVVGLVEADATDDTATAIQINEPEPEAEPERPQPDTRSESGSTGSTTLSRTAKTVTDWTVPNPEGELTPHLEFARSIDWGATALGPMESWSPELRQVANLCMSTPHPASVFWGSELTMMYNQAYATELGGKRHPTLMGSGFSGPWAEVWSALQPVFAETARTGVAFRSENNFFIINRNGFSEETYFSWSFTPLYGGTDRIVGFYNAPYETTRLVLAQRRIGTINNLSQNTTRATTVKGFWKAIIDGLQDNPYDIPFALLYSVGETEDGDHSSISSESTGSLKSCHLEGSIGVPSGHVAAPENIDLDRSREGFVPSFREAIRTREPTLLKTSDGTLPQALLEGITWRGFGEPCQEAIIFPVRPTNRDTVLAFLVLGVNPHRPYDESYESFSSLLNRQLATSLASAILFEEETRRSRNAVETAALENEELTQKLNLQASRLRRMTELSPLGMFLISPEGVLREANDRFYEMTDHSREKHDEMTWTDIVMDSSIPALTEGWHQLKEELLPWSGELQLNKTSANPVNPDGEPIQHWVMFSAHAEIGVEGSLRSIMGSITDISHLKWAQGLQERQLEKAEETRRQQNEFIDITSHEMRNPLSAILQCADDIAMSLDAYRINGESLPTDVIESCIDAAHTVALCVQHQKAIVDDILTISKLDSNLLLITPVPCQPAITLKRVMKMFELEVQAKDINLTLQIEASYQELEIDWLAMDPSRVLQILINLMTNAIKFTAPSKKREITVLLGVSTTPPDGSRIPGFQFAPATAGTKRAATFDNWEPDEALYVHFRVKDTGCGLSEEEQQLLFQRFKQASPRTHAQYGGSGLGLFISKRMAELHGGRIGVASKSGQGSEFGFYIQTRRTGPPSERSSPEIPSIEPNLSFDIPPTPSEVPERVATPVPAIMAAKTSTKFEPSDITILVVEDNLINQKILVNQLKKAGCNVRAANNGLETLEFLKKTEFYKDDGEHLSVVLMDLEMPKMDGKTCAREIRKMESEGSLKKHVPVIAVTANVRDEQVQDALQSGMDDVVSKPFRIPDLLKKIEALLEGLK